MQPSDMVTVVEVGPRDGLQNEPNFFPTEKKIEMINLLSETGLKRIEVTSFVHPKVVPQFKDAMEVLNGIRRKEGVIYSVLVPNIKGGEQAVQTLIDEISLFVSASETHNQKNVNMSIDESLKTLKDVAVLGKNAGKKLRGYVITAFGCPYEGRVSIDQVKRIIHAYGEMNVSEVSLGDTTGMANPRQVAQIMDTILKEGGNPNVAVHFHNSRGTGLANALAAYQAGIRIFDSSLGGIGGCPTAIGAMGNIATEDFVSMVEEMGVSTGVDIDSLIQVSRFVQEVLGKELPSHLIKVGRANWNGYSKGGGWKTC